MTPRTIPELLGRSDRLAPRRALAVVGNRPALTFEECAARSNALARGLQAREVRRGDRLALLFDNQSWLDFIVAYFGTLKSGATALLLSDRFTTADIQRIAGRSKVVGIATADSDAPEGPWWVATVGELTAGQSTAEMPPAARPADVAEVVFTSGTTALPRGVLVSHANLLRARSIWPNRTRARRSVLHAFPIGSVAAQTVLLDCVGQQQTMVTLPEFQVPAFAGLAREHGVAEVYLVPAMGHLLARTKPVADARMEGVRAVKFSGAPLPTAALPDLTAVFPAATFFNVYTSTEAFPARLVARVDARRPASLGVPIGSSTLRITATDGIPVDRGEVGEVWLRAQHAPMRRFLDDEPATEDTFQDGWVRTGDLGYLDADGHLLLVGRRTDIVNVGGLNVSTFRVEEALCRHPAVAEAAVVPFAHPVLGEVIAALVVLRAEATVRGIQQHARAQLARVEVPAVVRMVDRLPRNATGKVVKREIPALLGADGPAGFVPPHTDTERAVAALWTEVLGIDAISVHDDFFALGGDSVTTVELAVKLSQQLGVDVDSTALVERPTVAEIASHLEQSAGPVHAPSTGQQREPVTGGQRAVPVVPVEAE